LEQVGCLKWAKICLGTSAGKRLMLRWENLRTFPVPYEPSPDNAGSKGVTWKATNGAIVMATRKEDDDHRALANKL